MDSRNPTTTKRGPGRKHVQGHKHGKPPVAPKGNWLGQHTADAAKRERRALIALIGIRQYKRRDRRGNPANAKGMAQTSTS